VQKLISTTTAPGSITVTTTDDEINADGDCSLREAVLAASRDAPVDACPAGDGADTINLPPGVYALRLVGDEDEAIAGDLDVSTEISILGAGGDQSKIDGTGLHRLFHVLPTGNLTLSGLTLSAGQTLQGKEDGGGGAIFNQGSLTLSDCTLTGNTAQRRGGGLYNTGSARLIRCTVSGNQDIGGGGGGISNRGTLSLTDCAILGNSSPKHGGGISNNGGRLEMDGGTISGNVAGGSGGGIRNRNNGQITLHGVVLADNSAGDQGGGISNHGPLAISASRITGNQAGLHGGGIENGGDAQLTDVNITDNTADSDANGIGDGGGIYNFNKGKLQAQGGTISDNHDNSPGSSTPDCAGGNLLLENVQTAPRGGCEP